MVHHLQPSNEFDELMARQVAPQDYGVRQFVQGDNMAKMTMLAEQMAGGRATVPKHLQGNVADCLAIVMQAMQWNMNHYAVGQKTHLVNGILGYEAQLVNAVIQNSGAIRGSFHYEFQGEGQNVRCRVGAVLRGEDEVTWGQWLSAASVQTKNSPLWKTNPAQQLGYLQVKNWGRAYCPGAILGVYSTDELVDLSGTDGEDEPKTADPALKRGPQRKSATIEKATAQAESPAAPDVGGEASTGTAPTPAPAPTTTTTAASGVVSPGQVNYIKGKLVQAGVSEESVIARFSLAGLEHMSVAEFDTLKSELLGMS